MKSAYAKIPSVNDLLNAFKSEPLALDHDYLKILIEEFISALKENPDRFQLAVKSRNEIHQLIITHVGEKIRQVVQPSIDRVINATGVILHTGLGRAPLGQQIIRELKKMTAYVNLEFDLGSGKRGERLDHLIPLLRLITGSEDAVVTNNNAAAVLLILNSLARRKEVIVSRGELVEIGGSFRMPEVMKSSLARMVEIGSTNKTHLQDYEQAISGQTAAIMIVHPSNYKIIGFTQKPDFTEILDLAHRNNLPVIYDLGSGALIDMRKFGFEPEPLVREVLQMGFDVVCFSGDKLLGGPQTGIIVGKKKYLEKIKKNHLLRALRCDKITISLLSSVLRQYLLPVKLIKKNISLGLFARTQTQMKKMSRSILGGLNKDCKAEIKLIKAPGRVGSGAYPVYDIPALALQISSQNHSANQLAKKFRQQPLPILGYIADDLFHLHLLTLMDEDLPVITETINHLLCQDIRS
jgi:L-seryl-tRNA(Ser) seleniumtransferase